MSIYHKLECIHVAIQEAQNGNLGELDRALAYVEEIREPYLQSETSEPTIPEGSFHVQVGRDATAYFDAIIPATSLEEAKGKISKDGYDCDFSIVWNNGDLETFDNTEVCNITSPDGTSVRWTEQDGWEEEES